MKLVRACRAAAVAGLLAVVILVINATDLDQRFEKVRATPGVRVGTEPR